VDAAEDGDESIEVFLVPRDAEGLTIGPPDTKMGQSGALTSDVHFDEVFVPDEALIGGARGIGYRAAMTSLAKGRITIAALAVGQAVRAHEESVAFAITAQQGETNIGDFQLVQAMLADQRVGVDTGRSIVLEVARQYAAGSDRRVAPSVAKLYCTEMVGRVADLAVQIHGGSGYMRDYPVERIYRDVRLLRLYEGTSEIQRLIIGSNVVKSAQLSR
jgi:acyl-CoA dehydrogenase